MTDLTPTPAAGLAAATRNLDFNQPLDSGDPRWVDLSPARGNNVLNRLRKRLLRKQPGRPMHVVFASHRGAGKTTELNRLRHDLAEKYCCLYLEADGEHITLTDAQSARDQWAGGLRDKAFNNGWADVLGRIAETTRPEGGEDGLAVLFHRLAFKYNGTVWYDVHPALADLPEVQAGLKRRAATARGD